MKYMLRCFELMTEKMKCENTFINIMLRNKQLEQQRTAWDCLLKLSEITGMNALVL